MEKYKKLFKVPALILSIALFVVCITSLIVSCVRDATICGSYYGIETAKGITSEVSIDLQEDEKVVINIVATNEKGEIGVMQYKFDYKVVDGKFYMKNEADIIYEYVGEVSSTKIEAITDGVSSTFKNKSAVASIVLSSVFAFVFMLTSVAFGFYTFKGDKVLDLFKKQEKKEAESIEETNE